MSSTGSRSSVRRTLASSCRSALWGKPSRLSSTCRVAATAVPSIRNGSGRSGSWPISCARALISGSTSSRLDGAGSSTRLLQAGTSAHTRKQARAFQLTSVVTAPEWIRAIDGALSKIETSPRTPSSGPSPYRWLTPDNASSATCPTRSPASTFRWAPIQRTPGLTGMRDSVLTGGVRPRSARARRRWLEAEAAQHGLTLRAGQEIEKRAGQRGLLRRGDDSAWIDHGAIAVFRRPEPLLDPLGTRDGVRGVDEAGLGLAAHHVVEHLAHVLGEHELGLEAVPQPQSPQALFGVLPGRYGLGLADRDTCHSGVKQVRGLRDVQLRVDGLDDHEDIAR